MRKVGKEGGSRGFVRGIGWKGWLEGCVGRVG